MLPSNPNRKSFALSLNLPLARQPSRRPKDKSSSQPPLPSPLPEDMGSPRTPLFPASLHLKQEQPVLPLPLMDGLDPSEKMKLLRKTRKLSRILGEVPIPVSQTSSRTDVRLGLSGLPEEPSALQSASDSTSTSTCPSSSLQVFARMSTLKRSMTVGHNMAVKTQPAEMHRARSLASLRASLTVPPAAITTPPSPISPIKFSWHEKPLPPRSAHSCIRPPGDEAEEPAASSVTSLGRRDSILSASSSTTARRRDSTASSILLAERTPEQLQRARAAKLTRQLGENLPPDVLLRASSPTPRLLAPTPSLVSFADSLVGNQDRHGSVRRGKPAKRGSRDQPSSFKRHFSLDRPVFGSSNPDMTADTKSFDDTVKQRSLLRKSRSTSGKMRPMTASGGEMSLTRGPDVVDSDTDSDLDDEDFPRPLTQETQRTLNVRRARKMAQMFGNDPPLALFQITNFPPSASLSDALDLAGLGRCDSQATCPSVTPSQFPNPPDLDDDEKRYGRHDGTSAGNLSPLIFAQPGSSDSTTPYPTDVTGDGESELLPYLNNDCESLSDFRPTSPFTLPPLVDPLTCPSQASISVASTTSAPPLSAAASQHSQSPLTSQSPPSSSPIRSMFRAVSPPPLANMLNWRASLVSLSAPNSPPMIPSQCSPTSPVSPGLPGTVSASEVSPSDPMFRMRRLRAAKLSRFFGVGMNDITGMLANGSTPNIVPAAGVEARGSRPSGSSAHSGSTQSLSLSNSPSRSQHNNHDQVPPVPPVPPLEVFRMESVETFASPSSPRSSRWFTSSGQSEGDSEELSRRSRKSSGGRRSQSVSRPTRRSRAAPGQPQPPQPQPHPRQSSSASSVPVADRGRSNSEPEVSVNAPQSQTVPQAQVHGRAYSTTVEVSAEYRGPKYFFRESRQLSKTKELEMHAAIRELRKMK